MGFWIFMTCMNLLIPLIMIVMGIVFIVRPPKNINAIYGYRTHRSMINLDTWDFAHKYCGKIWIVIGSIMLPICLVIMLLIMKEDSSIVGLLGAFLTIIEIVPFIYSINPVEKALQKNFDEDGNRK